MSDFHDDDRDASEDALRSSEMIDSIWSSLCRYFNGEASPEDAAVVRRADAKLFRDTQLLWDAAGLVAAPASRPMSKARAAWKRELARLDAEAGANGNAVLDAARPPRRLSGGRRARWQRGSLGTILTAAAVFVVAIGVGRVLVQRHAEKKPVAAAPADRVFATRKAQRADVYLLDGTHVILNVDSRLRVPASYGQGARVVTLEGEAFFEVTHDSTRPFRVHTKAGVAEDLGTAFVVSSYAEDRGMRVSVSSGEVAVRRDSIATGATHLKRGDVARMDAAGGVTVRRVANIDEELAWTTGRLVFDRVPLKEALPKMSRWFDAEIRLGDSSLGNRPYGASFRNEPIVNVLELLAEALSVRVERDGNAYVIYPIKSAR